MSAPGGFVDACMTRLSQETGYMLIGTCREWLNSTAEMRLPCEINRVNIRRHFTLADFRRIVENDFGFYLRVRTPIQLTVAAKADSL